jgi:hypothetical protein
MRERARFRANGAARAASAFVGRHRLVWVLAAAAAAFLAGVGAFGSGAAPLPLRAAYWLIVMAIGGLIVSIAVDLFDSRDWLEEQAWLKGGALAFAVAFPQTAAVWAITNWLFDDPWRPERMIGLFPSVLLVTTAFVALHLRLGLPLLVTHAEPGSSRTPAFLERLPPRLRGGELYAVEAEDHYLRLHTSRGSALIAMRLGDALRELEGVEGAQVHRSWWVARDAVEHGVRRRGRAALTRRAAFAPRSAGPMRRRFAVRTGSRRTPCAREP